MARYLFACWPFPGHLFPALSVAVAVRERGGEAAFYTGEAARPHLEQEGFTLFPFEALDEQRFRRVQTREAGTAGRRQSLRVSHQAFRDWMVETIPGQVADLGAVIAGWKPDVVITDLSMWGPMVILHEKGPVPVAILSFAGTMIPGPDAPPWGFGLKPPRTATERALATVLRRGTDLVARGIRRRLDELRAEHGLGPLGGPVNAYSARLPLYLSATLAELDYNRRSLPASVHYVGPCIWNPPTSSETAAWLDAIPAGRPWVHVTEGTSHNQEPFLLRAGVEGLARRPMEVILTTGGQRDPETLGFGPVAPNIHLTRWVSHRELLPRCEAVVTTGGSTSIMAALQAGAPLVVVPTTWDKPDNARRVVEAGVGVRLAPRRCSPSSLRTAVEEVLGDPGYRARARHIADRLGEAPGPAGAAGLLEDLTRAVQNR
ncbi:MAG: glycosyltransferase [Acidimicrobiales bacterium]